MAVLPPSDVDYRGIEPEASLVRVIAVAGVIFGTTGMACMPFTWPEPLAAGWPVEQHKMTVLDLWCHASVFIGLGLSTILMFSSLGAYHFRWWAWYGLLFWAACSFAYGLVGTLFWGQFLLPWRRSDYVVFRSPDTIAPLIAWIIGTGLSVFVLLFLPRRAIRGVFRAPAHDIDERHGVQYHPAN
jgi:hypothetical protein